MAENTQQTGSTTDKLPPPLNEPCPKPDPNTDEAAAGGKITGVRIDPRTSPPYKYICALLMTASNGDKFLGTGFKIHVPNMNRCIVVTAGKNLFYDGQYMKSVEVMFPGKPPQHIDSKFLYVSSLYRNNLTSSDDSNYGIISLPGNSNVGFGWSAIAAANRNITKGTVVTVCGYPGERKPWPQMWMSGGEVTGTTNLLLRYNIGINPGQLLGSPVYMWYKGYWTVVGIHVRSVNREYTSSGCIFTGDMIYEILEFLKSLSTYTLESVNFPSVYLRCNGAHVRQFDEQGSGEINCQFGPPSDWETFYIFPTEVTPSLAQEERLIVTLLNKKWPNAFLRMDGKEITKFMPQGGGVVNCQFKTFRKEISESESFILKKDALQQSYFQSAKFPHRYLRLDGTGVTKWMNDGGGVVNCQYYNSNNDVTSWEKFLVKKR